jgi:hypothetical protein
VAAVATPFAIDCAIAAAARVSGYTAITRRPVVRIDPALLDARYYRKTPDYATLRRLLNEGQEIAGATLSPDVVYVLARPDAQDNAA